MLHKKEKSGKSIWSYLLLLPALAGIILFTSSFSLKSKLNNAFQKIKPVEMNTKNVPFLKAMKASPDTTIQGFIKSPDGKPLSNVTILAPNTNRGILTDKKGYFKLKNIPVGATLKISRVGYNTITTQVTEKSNFNMVLYPKPASLKEVSVTGYSNQPPPPPSAKPSKNRVFQFVEQMPSFPGGKTELMKYLHDNIRYPSAARENGIDGTVIVQFVVNKDGTLHDIRTVGKKKGGGLEEEAMRVVKNMPKWKPGKQNGENVRVQYNLPIRFMLQ